MATIAQRPTPIPRQKTTPIPYQNIKYIFPEFYQVALQNEKRLEWLQCVEPYLSPAGQERLAIARADRHVHTKVFLVMAGRASPDSLTTQESYYHMRVLAGWKPAV